MLTIMIPTYNREAYLSKLLTQLEIELRGLESLVNVVISDNHSTDNTPDVINKFIARNLRWKSNRHPSNLGCDGNLLACVNSCESKYFWMIGDDDLPRSGLIQLLVEILANEQPTLLYLNSHWESIVDADDFARLQTIDINLYNPVAYAKKINIYTTFLSAWIIDSCELKRLGLNYAHFARGAGTSLLQLGWILPLIRASSKLLAIDETCILATGGNTGGYKLLTTFCVNYPNFVYRIFPRQPKMHQALLAPPAKDYLPSLIAMSRSGHFNRMHNEGSILPATILKLGLYREFWAYTFPAIVFPVKGNGDLASAHLFSLRKILHQLKARVRPMIHPLYTVLKRKSS
jgi:abequosyltransferase